MGCAKAAVMDEDGKESATAKGKADAKATAAAVDEGGAAATEQPAPEEGKKGEVKGGRR